MSDESRQARDTAGHEVRPVVGVSRCLGFAACRWDGATIASDEVAELARHADLRPLCPEVEMGLGLPRDPIRIVTAGDARRLVQPATGRDLTDAMGSVVRRCVDELAQADGLILKSRSPSCGLYDARVYASAGAEAAFDEASRGAFAAGILARLPHLAVEDEVGLKEPSRRHHFLTRLYAQARFRAVRAEATPEALVRYQSDNKLLLMAYDKRRLGALGRLVATVAERPMHETLDAYAEHLYAALAQPARPSAHVNALMHAMGYFRRALTRREKDDFLGLLEGYRQGHAPLSAPVAVLRSWVARFGEPYLGRQTYLQPYPDSLARGA